MIDSFQDLHLYFFAEPNYVAGRLKCLNYIARNRNLEISRAPLKSQAHQLICKRCYESKGLVVRRVVHGMLRSIVAVSVGVI